MISTDKALQIILAERKRQVEKWGIQYHDKFTWLAILGEEFGESSQAALHDQFGGHAKGTFLDEIAQVTAVGLQIIEMLGEE